MKKKPEIEVRSCEQEIRAIGEDGTFEGYITKWGTVDTYDSTFLRGSFKKTISERGHKIKVFFDHTDLVGRSVEIREDDVGVFVRGQLTLAVEKAADTYEFLKDKTLDALSFGFRTIKDKWVNGVRQISEVKLYEYGPVVFEANENATITDVRAERILDMNKSTEERATDFARTKELQALSSSGWRLIDALTDTIWDIWWSGEEGVQELMAKAIDAFRTDYLAWVDAYIAEFWDTEERSAPIFNQLSTAFGEYLAEDETRSVDTLAMTTVFTRKELHLLKRGKPIQTREKLSELPEAIREAHNEVRNTAVEALFSELRAGLSTAEKSRVLSLLQPADDDSLGEPALENAMTNFKSFRKSITNLEK